MSPVTFTIQFGGRLVFGAGTLSALPREAAKWSDRAFVATTRDLTALGLTGRVRRLLCRFLTRLEAGADRVGLVLEQAREILRGHEEAGKEGA